MGFVHDAAPAITSVAMQDDISAPSVEFCPTADHRDRYIYEPNIKVVR